MREITVHSRFSHELTLEAISRIVPVAIVQEVLADHSLVTERERKLSLVVTLFLTITLHLFTGLSLGHVLQKMAQGLRFIWSDPDYRVAGASAITYRRYQLGARPLVALFHRICRPLATPRTPGAFLFGLRLMAIDGTVEDVADTPANVAAFGRYHGHRGDGAFPQVQGVYLVECGTHAIVDAGFWPCHVSEKVGGFRVLRSVTPAMLVMWDRGFHDYDRIQAVVQRQSHVLARLSSLIKPEDLRCLPDGSYLARIRPADRKRHRTESMVVRIIAYTLTDPALPGYGETHRLLTTLLDPGLSPATDLVCAYHERWEVELVVDETDTHQRLAGRPLRSQKPVGVIQELYALLLAHYVIRFLMHEAALAAGVDPDRLSFTHAVQVLQAAIPEFQMAARDDLPHLYARLLRDMAAELLPERRLRSNPRVVKRKMSNFRLKRSQHQHWPQPQRPLREAVMLI